MKAIRARLHGNKNGPAEWGWFRMVPCVKVGVSTNGGYAGYLGVRTLTGPRRLRTSYNGEYKGRE